MNLIRKLKYRYKENLENGFTITELLVASAISMFVLAAGYTLVRMTVQVNKSDETYMKLSGKIDNALDFIVDEINSSKRILTNFNQLPSRCSRPNGEFVIGMMLYLSKQFKGCEKFLKNKE